MANKQREAAKCIICGNQAERCHVKSRGSGGTDDDWNIMSMCRKHHQEQHFIGWTVFYFKYPEVQPILRDKGWSLDSYTNRLFNPNNAKA